MTRKLMLCSLFCLTAGAAFAGRKSQKEVLSLSNGKYVETFDQDSIEQIGNILYNVNSRQIIGFVTKEQTDSATSLKPEIISRWLSVDPLAAKTPGISPYVFCENNPILNLDPDGRLSINYTQKDLASAGLTQVQMTRFETIVRNLPNLFAGNAHAMEALRNTTGFSNERIVQDFTFGNGPGINLVDNGGGGSGYASGIYLDPRMIKSLANIDPSNIKELSYAVLGMGLTLAHEYSHYGDEITNGHKTGEWVEDKSKKIDLSPNGTQRYLFSPTGHRGTDVETIGFGVQVSTNLNGTFIIETKKEYSKFVGKENLPPVPQQLPDNASGTNILNTLSVK